MKERRERRRKGRLGGRETGRERDYLSTEKDRDE